MDSASRGILSSATDELEHAGKDMIGTSKSWPTNSATPTQKELFSVFHVLNVGISHLAGALHSGTGKVSYVGGNSKRFYLIYLSVKTPESKPEVQ